MILSRCRALKWLFVFFNLKMVNVWLCILLLCVSLRKVSLKQKNYGKSKGLR